MYIRPEVSPELPLDQAFDLYGLPPECTIVTEGLWHLAADPVAVMEDETALVFSSLVSKNLARRLVDERQPAPENKGIYRLHLNDWLELEFVGAGLAKAAIFREYLLGNELVSNPQATYRNMVFAVRTARKFLPGVELPDCSLFVDMGDKYRKSGAFVKLAADFYIGVQQPGEFEGDV